LFLSRASRVMTSAGLEIRRAVFVVADASSNAATNIPMKGNRDGKDRDERPAERLARRRGPGPGRSGGLQAGRMVRPVWGQGPRRVEQGRARRGARRRGVAAGSEKLRVFRG